MSNGEVLPELSQILGSMIFGSNRSLTIREMRKCLADVAEECGAETEAFGKVRESDIHAALELLGVNLIKARCGFSLTEVAGGYRLQSDAACGKWLKSLLNMGKPNRMSHPSLETLAIIAYRQPISRADIEAVRGVQVDHVVKALLEMQLIKIVGRSELPGRPFLYGTTHTFLEHFGLRSLEDLNALEPMFMASREAGRPRRPPAAEPTEGSKEMPAEPGGPEAESGEGRVEEEGEHDATGNGDGVASDASAEEEEAAEEDDEDEYEDDDDEDEGEDGDGDGEKL